jgi:hypothetical protein
MKQGVTLNEGKLKIKNNKKYSIEGKMTRNEYFAIKSTHSVPQNNQMSPSSQQIVQTDNQSFQINTEFQI